MSNKTKNPLRTLASTLVSACKERGLKQSVILDVLSKQQGYRSIQASDNSNTPASTSVNPKAAFLHGVLLSTPDVFDMMPVSLEEDGGKPVPEKGFGDRYFDELWHELYHKPEGFYYFMEELRQTLRDIELHIEECREENDAAFSHEIYANIINTQDTLSDRMKAFLIDEGEERSRGNANPNEELAYSITRIKEDCYAVSETFVENDLAHKYTTQ